MGGRVSTLFRCAWKHAVFIHYSVDPAALQPQVDYPLETFDGRAYVSLVALTLRNMRLAAGGPPMTTHGFLNVRTYLPGRGIYFLAEWLPHPLCVLLGPRLYGLPYRLGKLDYHHEGKIHGSVVGEAGALRYRATSPPDRPLHPAEPGSLPHFLVERYTAFTERAGRRRLFRVNHPPWNLAPLDLDVTDDSLLNATGPWFHAARRIGAHYSPGFEKVGMGRPLEQHAWKPDERCALGHSRLVGETA